MTSLRNMPETSAKLASLKNLKLRLNGIGTRELCDIEASPRPLTMQLYMNLQNIQTHCTGIAEVTEKKFRASKPELFGLSFRHCLSCVD